LTVPSSGATRGPARGSRPRRTWRRAPALLASFALAVGAFAAARVVREEPLRRRPGLSVLLVTVDTLRADAVGAYGRAGADTPRMDRLAAEGVRFTFAHAQSVVTLPSHANILSGRYPFDHGVRDNSGFRFPKSLDTLATLLRAHGYRTGAFLSAFPLDSRFGLDRGFEVYDDRLGDFEVKPDFQMQERPGPETVAAARTWRESTPGPTFCWVHLYEPHAPYDPPFEWQGRFPSAYDAEVAAADAALGPLLDPLFARGAQGDTLVVLTADHGEGRGEHGEATHGIFTYETTLRVPLLLYCPRLFRSRVVTAGARHVDILPTVLDALGFPLPEDLPGRSLLRAAEGLGDGPEPPSYFESLTPALTRGWAPAYGVLRGRLKYIDLPIPELYDLRSDPREQTNLAPRQPERVAAMRSLLSRERGADPGAAPGTEDAEVRERLLSLGYVTGESPIARRYGVDDDPKRNLDFETRLDEVIRLYDDGDLEGALARCERLVRDRPRVPLGLRHLSFLRRQAGDLEGAVEAGRRALAADPASVDSAAQLGHFLNDLGRPREAVALLAPYARPANADLDVLMTYGAGLAEDGRRTAAIEALQRARRLDPTSALAAFNLGTAHLLFGDRETAREEFEEALRLEPELGRAMSALGVLAAKEGRPREAVRRWKQAIGVNPRDADSLYNLGTLLRDEGRVSEARRYLRLFLDVAPPALYGPDCTRVRAWLATSATPGVPARPQD
jgi:arylsulfatase A-like enzyme/Tfp pilus assembly protein PilF